MFMEEYSEKIRELLIYKARNNKDREAYLKYTEIGYTGHKSEFNDKIKTLLCDKGWATDVKSLGSGQIRCIVFEDLL